MYFIDVILPIPLRQKFTYSVTADQAANLEIGYRVAVPFGKTKVYTAIVVKVHQNAPVGYDTKEIDQILDNYPIVTINQLQHWQWMATYYMCTLGEVIRAALPSAYLLESETSITISKSLTLDESQLTDDEFVIFEALQHQNTLLLNDIRNILDRKNVVGIVQKLLSKNIIQVKEEVFETYKPKFKRYIKLAPKNTSEEKLQAVLETLSNAPKQRDVLMTLFMLQSKSKKSIESIVLQNESKASASTIKSLLDKEILEEYFLQKDRIEYDGEEANKPKKLNEGQEKALNEIKNSFETNDVCLLHGVTSSGKTEIYVQLIADTLAKGEQVLYMLPEIALTTQLISRLQNHFSHQVSVYHSKYSIHERVEVWNNLLENSEKTQIILGARSSLFLPFTNLGLVIIDEEHEPSFKQYNPSPRYHARDAAIILANLSKAKVILGSATPSLESYHNAKLGKYGLVNLTKRFGEVVMPSIELVDIKTKHIKKQMTGHFSDLLLEEINKTLKLGEQVLLFQNRRGYSPVVECTTCGTTPQCPNCDVSLTYHQYKNQLRCHYCGYHIAMIQECIACGSNTLDRKGFGTEQIETELNALFPKYNIARMDQDTMKGKHAYAKIIEKLENQEIDILVGTQMLAKGLDFRNISLVGVMNADNLLFFPDFRAHERSYQLLQQVSGRAGRTKKQGKVLIQTYNPLHQILQMVCANDYVGMYKMQTEERYQFKYPPFYKLIRITFKHRDQQKVEIAATWFAEGLKLKLKENILGPEAPPVSRIRNKYITNVLVKIPKKQSLDKTKKYIDNVQRSFSAIKDFSTVQLQLDVDNY